MCAPSAIVQEASHWCPLFLAARSEGPEGVRQGLGGETTNYCRGTVSLPFPMINMEVRTNVCLGVRGYVLSQSTGGASDASQLANKLAEANIELHFNREICYWGVWEL